MKIRNTFATLVVLGTIIASSSAMSSAQTPETAGAKTRQRFAAKTTNPGDETKEQAVKPQDPVKAETEPRYEGDMNEPTAKPAESVSPANAVEVTNAGAEKKPTDIPDDTKANRHEQPSEEAAVVPYYNNFFNTYRLGPEDIVSVNVFGQDRYSRSGIIIPPSGRISLALIPGGIFVNGKTVDEVADSIKKRYDEYIIDPQVTVSLDKASSYRYSVIGDVGQPGIRMMSHRMTVAEAIGEAGGVLSTGNRSKIIVLRRQADGNLTPIPVNLTAIYKGKAPDITYLVPGDQVIVPGNKLKTFQKIMTFFPVMNFARIFTGGLLP